MLSTRASANPDAWAICGMANVVSTRRPLARSTWAWRISLAKEWPRASWKRRSSDLLDMYMAWATSSICRGRWALARMKRSAVAISRSSMARMSEEVRTTTRLGGIRMGADGGSSPRMRRARSAAASSPTRSKSASTLERARVESSHSSSSLSTPTTATSSGTRIPSATQKLVTCRARLSLQHMMPRGRGIVRSQAINSDP